MAFDISLTSGMRNNLVALQSTARLLSRTQDRLSTGKAVNTAIDDPAKFFAAQAHNDHASDLSARKADMGEAALAAKAANTGITGIIALISQAKGLVQSARSATVTDRASLAAQFNTIRAQIDQMAADSGYNGKNFLQGETLKVQFNEDGSSFLTVTGFQANASGIALSTAALGLFTASYTAETVNSTSAAMLSGATYTLANFGTVQAITLTRTADITSQTLANSTGATTAIDVTTSGDTLTLGHVGAASSLTLKQTYSVTAATVITVTAGSVALTAGSNAYITGTTGINAAPSTVSVTSQTGAEALSTNYTILLSAADNAYYLHAVTDLTGTVAITFTAGKNLTVGTDYSVTNTGSGTSAGVITASRDITGIVQANYTFADTLTAGSGASYVDSAVGNISASTITFSGGITGVITATYTTTGGTLWRTDTALDTDTDNLNAAVLSLRTQASTMAANLSVILARQNWSQGMVDTLTAGADGLTLADMNEEGANLLALQTRQQLGIQALSLASQANQSVMRLFG
jgi:flagellin